MFLVNLTVSVTSKVTSDKVPQVLSISVGNFFLKMNVIRLLDYANMKYLFLVTYF